MAAATVLVYHWQEGPRAVVAPTLSGTPETEHMAATAARVAAESGAPETPPAVETATPGTTSGGDAVSASVPTLWRAIDERTVDVKPAFTDGWSQAGRVLVDVTRAAAEARTWQVGDPVGIDIPQIGARYEATIDRIDAGPGYASAARGLATDADGRKRRFVVTVGPGRVFAYVDTPAGPYELIGSDRLAWLLPSSSMMAGIDFSKPDYILPGKSRGSFDAEGEAR